MVCYFFLKNKAFFCFKDFKRHFAALKISELVVSFFDDRSLVEHCSKVNKLYQRPNCKIVKTLICTANVT